MNVFYLILGHLQTKQVFSVYAFAKAYKYYTFSEFVFL